MARHRIKKYQHLSLLIQWSLDTGFRRYDGWSEKGSGDKWDRWLETDRV